MDTQHWRDVARTGWSPLLLLVSAVALASCQPPDVDDIIVGEPQRGGTAVAGKRTDFSGLNSITNTDLYTDELIKYGLFTPLVQYDEDLNVVPYLAQSWEMLGDTGVVFQLRRDVRWHDGEPVTARDVVFTFERAKDPETASLLGEAYLGDVARAEIIDSFTVRFDFERPHAQAMEDFWWAPMPAHLLESVPPSELRNAPFNREPVGSGPYRFVRWRANDQLVVERNPDFPEALGGPPYLDRVVFRVIPEAATLLTEQLTDRLDVDLNVEPDQAEQIEDHPRLDLIAYPGRTFAYIGWNNRREPFTSPAMRRAMTLGINRQEIVDALLFGYGVPALATIPPWHPFYAKDLEPLPYDPTEAGKLLDAEGWKDRRGTGMRENGAGVPLRFTLKTSDSPLSRAVVEVVQAQLRRIGVGVRLEVLEFQTLLSQHRARDFDAVFSSWVLDNFQMTSTPASLFHSRLADVPESSNRSGFADPRADRLIEEGATATNDDDAAETWRDFAVLLQELQPFTFMYWREELSSTSARIQGVVMDPRGELLTMKEWWLAGS